MKLVIKFQTHAAKGTLDFDEDPFKNANHRYGDPFELTGADPDPFARYDAPALRKCISMCSGNICQHHKICERSN